MTDKILVIEDDKDIANILNIHLKDMGYDVTVAHDGSTGLEQAETNEYNLIILDLMLPGIDGLDICKRVRGSSHYTPILMLTSKSSELDRVLGLEIGADDYLTKPFSVRELQARVKALFRRVEALKSQSDSYQQETIVRGDLILDVEKRKVTKNGETVPLTAKEFDLLLHFVRNPGRVYSRTQLLDVVWGYKFEGYEHTVNSHINRLRMKIEKDPAHPVYLLTVWGVGYKFSDDV
jgi:two-component system OmpR family response regulator